MSFTSKEKKKLKRKYDILVCELKVADDVLDECSSEAQDGHLDLMFRLNELKPRIGKDQQANYSKNILGRNEKQLEVSNTTHDHHNSKESETVSEDIVLKKNKKVGWQKSLMRAVVLKTHPDKLLNYTCEDRDYYCDVCKRALNAYDTDDDARLMSSAGEVRIRPVRLNNKHIKILSKEINKVSVLIKQIKQEHGYVWYYLSDLEKETFLVNHIKQLGYSIDIKTAQDAIKKRRPASRKPGTRPEKQFRRKD